MAQFRKLTRQQLFAHVRKNGMTQVWLMPSKMYLNTNYASVTTLLFKNNAIVTSNVLYTGENQTFDHYYNNWSYYNTNYECGYYAHYYIAV